MQYTREQQQQEGQQQRAAPERESVTIGGSGGHPQRFQLRERTPGLAAATQASLETARLESEAQVRAFPQGTRGHARCFQLRERTPGLAAATQASMETARLESEAQVLAHCRLWMRLEFRSALRCYLGHFQLQGKRVYDGTEN